MCHAVTFVCFYLFHKSVTSFFNLLFVYFLLYKSENLCPSLDLPPLVFASTDQTSFETQVTLTCTPGHMFVNGSLAIEKQCGDWEQWLPDSAVLTCISNYVLLY